MLLIRFDLAVFSIFIENHGKPEVLMSLSQKQLPLGCSCVRIRSTVHHSAIEWRGQPCQLPSNVWDIVATELVDGKVDQGLRIHGI